LRPVVRRRGAAAELLGDGVAVRLRGQSKRLVNEHVTSASLSPDGRLLVTTSKIGPPRVWVVASGALRKSLAGHAGRVNDADFSPDGRWIVTAGTTAGIWNGRTGRRLMFVRGSQPLTSATFDPTGRTILTGGVDGTVRTYRCDLCGNLDELLALAGRRLAATKR
jgi:WD40 repeat protein